MKRFKSIIGILAVTAVVVLAAACGQNGSKTTNTKTTSTKSKKTQNTSHVTAGKTTYRGFQMNNVLHDSKQGDIHYHLYTPQGYRDDGKPYALFITLPGYQGLYFQGVGENLKTEDFGFEAQQYNSRMIIAAPQLEDWNDTSADQTIALTKYLIAAYNINPKQVYIEGYSGGGETLSRVLGKQPDLYTAALLCSSQWDGGYDRVVKTRTPVYLVVGESDEYYGASPFRKAYRDLHQAYEKAGLSDAAIDKLLVLDVKDAAYFEKAGVTNQHGGGETVFARDAAVMNWLFGKH